MREQTGIPVIVVSQREDDAEAISRALRNAGQAAHCQWVNDPRSLPYILSNGRAQLLFVVLQDDIDQLVYAAGIRDRQAGQLPILAVAAVITEKAIVNVLVNGAMDLVSLADPQRLSAVALRELRAHKMARKLVLLTSENIALQEQLSSMIDESADATLFVAEGIIANVNRAWTELFGYSDASDLIGTPILDVFAVESQAAIKGALVACEQGKWTGHRVSVKVQSSDGGTLTMQSTIETGQHDGEPCVRISMESDTPTVVTAMIAEHRHPVTGLFLRKHFVEKLGASLKGPTAPGVTVLAYLKPDEMDETRNLLDPISSDQLMLDMARMLRESVKSKDLYGQFGGDIFMVLLNRGTMRDVRAWADELLRTVRQHVFVAGDKSVPMTCTVGLAQHNTSGADINALMHQAQLAFRNGREAGGDKVLLLEKDGSVGKTNNTVTVDQIKHALMKDGFRLVFQPVASMMGKSRRMFDVLIRMMDEDGKEIMPGEFLPVARENGLMKNIDRWVIGNSIAYCVKGAPTQLFIRLSEESIPDRTLIPWIGKQLEGYKVPPSQLVFQVTENHAEEHLKEVKDLAQQVKAFGCAFAVEHFGTGHRPLQVLEHVSTDFIKVDGSLMEGLVRNREIQAKVRLYIETAKAKNIETVAERVEDANTMAVLWQLGVEFIQGYYVQGPEEIVLESELSATD